MFWGGEVSGGHLSAACLLVSMLSTRVRDYPPQAGSWRLGGRQGSKGAEGEGEDRREYVKDDLSKLGSRTPIAL